MRERLENFKELCEKYEQARGRSDRYTDAQRALDEEMSLQIPTVRKILRLLDPSLPDEVKRPLYIGGTSDSRHAVQMGLEVVGIPICFPESSFMRQVSVLGRTGRPLW
jgi:hypothetical protein